VTKVYVGTHNQSDFVTFSRSCEETMAAGASYQKHNTPTTVDPASSPSSIEERKLLPTGRRSMASLKALFEEES